MGIDAGRRLLLDGGRVPASGLAENYQRSSWAACPSAFKVRSGRPGRPWLPPHDPQLAEPGSGPGLLRGDGPAGPGDRERLPPGVCPPCGGCGQPEGPPSG